MLSTARIWTLGLLVLGMKGSFVQAHNEGYHAQSPSTKIVHETTTQYYQSLIKEVDTVSTTVLTTATDIATVPTTSTVHTTNTVTTTDTCTVTDTTTVPTTVTVHITATVITTLTATATDTTTIPTTTTITSTITLFPTLTDTSTSTFYDPCPKSCSISVDTVTLVYWPTRYPNVTYPATYVDPTIAGYTFTSPSVYYIINTMVGTNSAGRVPGKDAHSTIYPFDLSEVSTLVLPEQTETRQLTLNDLGTACPRSLDASVVVTKLRDSVCDPVLAAPYRIRSWAFPCNACGPFGLFDPPYAVPTLSGGLLGPSTPPAASATAAPTQAPPPPPPQSSAAPPPPPPPPPASTAAPPPPPPPPASSAPPPPPPVPTTSAAPAPTVTPPSSATSVVPVQTALAPKMTGETGFLIMSLFVSMFFLF